MVNPSSLFLVCCSDVADVADNNWLSHQTKQVTCCHPVSTHLCHIITCTLPMVGSVRIPTPH